MIGLSEEQVSKIDIAYGLASPESQEQIKDRLAMIARCDPQPRSGMAELILKHIDGKVDLYG